MLFAKGCAKIHYCQADVRQNETLQNERQIERFDRIENETQKSTKLKAEIDFNNLNFKQQLLLKTPQSIVSTISNIKNYKNT